MPATVQSPAPREHPLKLAGRMTRYPWDDLAVKDWFFAPDPPSCATSHANPFMIKDMIKRRGEGGDRRKWMAIRDEKDGILGHRVVRIK